MEDLGKSETNFKIHSLKDAKISDKDIFFLSSDIVRFSNDVIRPAERGQCSFCKAKSTSKQEWW